MKLPSVCVRYFLPLFLVGLAAGAASLLPASAQGEPGQPVGSAASTNKPLSASLPPGVTGGGQADDTAALQRALDDAGKKGGEVYLPPGLYRIDGTVRVPTGVTLRGSWDAPHHGAWEQGSTLMVTGGRGRENGPAAVELQQSSAIQGFTFVWPDQRSENIVPYPWAIHGTGMHNTVENITFVNAYQGIAVGPGFSELHLIRNVFGAVLRRGIFIDSTSDVGRIENVHFNPHYWARSGHPSIPHDRDHTGDTARYMQDHLEAFIFGRTDWEYVLNTFVFAAKIGYHFIETKDGACNGQFLGIGADGCRACVQIDHIQDIGLQITNGEFTAFAGDPNTAVVTSPGANGSAQFVNCNFWGIASHIAMMQGDTALTFSSCHFVDVPDQAILAERGKLIVQACNFGRPGTAIVLRPGVRSAVVTGNLQSGGLDVQNEIGSRAQIGLNETAAPLPVAQALHYRFDIGAPDDAIFLRGQWYGPEKCADAPPGSSTCRWTNGRAGLRLPVTPGQNYTLTLWVGVDPHAKGELVTVDGSAAEARLQKPGIQRIRLPITAGEIDGRQGIAVLIAGPTWSPHAVDPENGDTRQLGVKVFRVEMAAASATNTTPFLLNARP